MHDLLFAQAQHPPTARVLGLVLQPYSIGHDILLVGKGNVFAKGHVTPPLDKEGRADLIEAVLICCRSWTENQKPHKYLRLWWAINAPADFSIEVDKFNSYRAFGTLQPPVTNPDGMESARPLGSPFSSLLIQFLVGRMGKTELEALNYPLALAKFHFYANCEAKGLVKVLNEREIAFEEFCASEDAKAEEAKNKEANASTDSNNIR